MQRKASLKRRQEGSCIAVEGTAASNVIVIKHHQAIQTTRSSADAAPALTADESTFQSGPAAGGETMTSNEERRSSSQPSRRISHCSSIHSIYRVLAVSYSPGFESFISLRIRVFRLDIPTPRLYCWLVR